jgi:preprotein translocase subunit YajC
MLMAQNDSFTGNMSIGNLTNQTYNFQNNMSKYTKLDVLTNTYFTAGFTNYTKDIFTFAVEYGGVDPNWTINILQIEGGDFLTGIISFYGVNLSYVAPATPTTTNNTDYSEYINMAFGGVNAFGVLLPILIITSFGIFTFLFLRKDANQEKVLNELPSTIKLIVITVLIFVVLIFLASRFIS